MSRRKLDIRAGPDKAMDKEAQLITPVEVGIACQENLVLVEKEKARKYDLLADELALIYKCRARVIPYVMTWEGIVSKRHKKYSRALEVTKRVQAYLQSRVLKRTLETISFEHRRSIEDGAEKEAVEVVMEGLLRHANVPPASEKPELGETKALEDKEMEAKNKAEDPETKRGK